MLDNLHLAVRLIATRGSIVFSVVEVIGVVVVVVDEVVVSVVDEDVVAEDVVDEDVVDDVVFTVDNVFSAA